MDQNIEHHEDRQKFVFRYPDGQFACKQEPSLKTSDILQADRYRLKENPPDWAPEGGCAAEVVNDTVALDIKAEPFTEAQKALIQHVLSALQTGYDYIPNGEMLLKDIYDEEQINMFCKDLNQIDTVMEKLKEDTA